MPRMLWALNFPPSFSPRLQVDKYDLYGSVAYPKHHSQEDVGDIYRYAAETNGVFGAPGEG